MTGSHEIRDETTKVTTAGKGTETSYKRTETLPDGTLKIVMEYIDAQGRQTMAAMAPHKPGEIPTLTPAEMTHVMDFLMRDIGQCARKAIEKPEPPASPNQQES